MNPAARRLFTPEQAASLAGYALANIGLGEEGGLVRWSHADGQPPKLLWVTPMMNGSSTAQYCAITVCDVNPDVGVQAEILTSLFRLTKAEIRLAQQMLAGHTPAEAAEQMGVTIHTVRTYLKRLYLKTSVKTQAALVRKLLQCTLVSNQSS